VRPERKPPIATLANAGANESKAKEMSAGKNTRDIFEFAMIFSLPQLILWAKDAVPK